MKDSTVIDLIIRSNPVFGKSVRPIFRRLSLNSKVRFPLLAQFIILVVLLLCHHLSLFQIFASKTIWHTEELSKSIYSKKGLQLEQETIRNLIRLEAAIYFRAWQMKKKKVLFRTSKSNQGITVFTDVDNHISIITKNKQNETFKVPSDNGFVPRAHYQALLEMEPKEGNTHLTFYNRLGIENGLLERKVLKFYRIGVAEIFNNSPQVDVLYGKLFKNQVKGQLHRGKMPIVQISWIKLITQNKLQFALEILYYVWWAFFWMQLLVPIAKEAITFIRNFTFADIKRSNYNSVISFVLVFQGYLLVSMFIMYLIPAHRFGNLPGFFYFPWDRFRDFYDVVAWSASSNPYINEYTGGGPVYYPFIMLLMKPFAFFPVEDLKWVVVMFVVGASWYSSRMLAPQANEENAKTAWWLFGITLCSYPVLFAMDRGNIDLLILLFVVLYLIYLRQGRSILAGTWIGFAIAAKAFPGLFILLSLRKRDFKSIFVAGIVTVLTTLLSLEIFGGDYITTIAAFRGYFKNFEDVYLVNSLVNFNHFSDLFSLLKTMVFLGWLPITAATLHQYYAKFALVFIAIIVYAVVFRKDEPEYMQLGLIAIGVIVFPGLAYDYRLIFLLPAVYAFFYREENHPRDKVFWLFSLLILSPKHFGLISGKWFLTCFVNPILNVAFILYGAKPHEKWAVWMQQASSKVRSGLRLKAK